MALPTAPQIAPLLTRSFIYLKNKQIEVIHENSKNLNQTKLIFRHALGNARYRGGPGFGVQIKVRSILSEFYINFDIP